jgi:hypothetical protein
MNMPSMLGSVLVLVTMFLDGSTLSEWWEESEQIPRGVSLTSASMTVV